MPGHEQIQREISYWQGFRDALELSLLKPEKNGAMHNRAIEKIDKLKRALRESEAREIIESQSRPSETLQDQEGHDTSKEVI